MWPDNETDLDLLGFDELVDELVVALSTPRLLPLTVGILGDWGSGKSSLLQITRRELESEKDDEGRQRYLCVSFSPWLYEDYDDVKTALMGEVLSVCRTRAVTPEVQEQAEKLGRFSKGLRGRGRLAGRAAVLAVPAVLAAVDPSLADTSVAAVEGGVKAVAPVLAQALADKPTGPRRSPICRPSAGGSLGSSPVWTESRRWSSSSTTWTAACRRQSSTRSRRSGSS